MTTYSITIQSLVGTGAHVPNDEDAANARVIVGRMNELLAPDNIQVRIGRQDSAIDFEHRCNIQNALARAHTQSASRTTGL